jgi:hypothetical protein
MALILPDKLTYHRGSVVVEKQLIVVLKLSELRYETYLRSI